MPSVLCGAPSRPHTHRTETHTETHTAARHDATSVLQPGRREGREDCAGSGDADEDEGAEALPGFFRLVEMWGVLCGRRVRLREGSGRISREASGAPQS